MGAEQQVRLGPHRFAQRPAKCLRAFQILQPRLVPWALGVNGGASVIGSVACVILAMELGFTAVAIASALIYLAAVLIATTGPLARPTD